MVVTFLFICTCVHVAYTPQWDHDKNLVYLRKRPALGYLVITNVLDLLGFLEEVDLLSRQKGQSPETRECLRSPPEPQSAFSLSPGP